MTVLASRGVGLVTAVPRRMAVGAILVALWAMPFAAAPAQARVAPPSAGTVSAWGFDGDGELGNGTVLSSDCRCISTPVKAGIAGVTAISGGAYHSLALRSDRTVWAWGDDTYGQLGNGTATTASHASSVCRCFPAPVRVEGLTGITAIAGGWYHSLALKSDGTVWAWGSTLHGELGTGITTAAAGCNCIPRPVRVAGLTGVIAISGGAYHSLALKSNGTVWAWGDNLVGQLGNGTTTTSGCNCLPRPVQVAGLTGVTAVAAGHYHSLALKSNGTVWAWGDNFVGQLGNGTSTYETQEDADCDCIPTPVQVSGLTGVTAIAGGGFLGGGNPIVEGLDQSKALKSNGTVWAWGFTGAYRSSLFFDSTPVRVPGLTGVIAIAQGPVYTLALKSNGTVWAWGDDTAGELGDGTNTWGQGGDGACCVSTPVKAEIIGATAIAAGGAHGLALTSP